MVPLKMAEQEAIGLRQQLARDFARPEFPGRPDLTSARARLGFRV